MGNSLPVVSCHCQVSARVGHAEGGQDPTVQLEREDYIEPKGKGSCSGKRGQVTMELMKEGMSSCGIGKMGRTEEVRGRAFQVPGAASA